MAEPLVTELKLEWAMRQLEERDLLCRNLRANVDALLDQLADAAARNETLKRVQDALTREKIAAERHVETLMHEKAELASENARLHIFAKEARAQADRASRAAREQQLFSEARAQADELLLAAAPSTAVGVDATGGPPTENLVAADPQPEPPAAAASSAELRDAHAQLHALKLVLARVLHGLGTSGLQLDRAALLAPERPETRGALERALRRAILAPGDASAVEPLGGDTGAPPAAASLSATGAVDAEGGTRPDPAAPVPAPPATTADPDAAAGPTSAPPAPASSSAPPPLPARASPAPASGTHWGGGLGILLSAATLGFWSVLVGDQSDEPLQQPQPGDAGAGAGAASSAGVDSQPSGAHDATAAAVTPLETLEPGGAAAT